MQYPDPNDEDFNNFINEEYSEYKISRRRKSLEQICFPKKYQFQIPQKFLAEYINPQTPYRGILVYHRIGAGKTCTAIKISEKFIGLRKIYVVLPAALKGNFRSELRSLCTGNTFMTKDERMELSQLHPASDEYKNIIKKTDERIDKHYVILSYNKFIDSLSKKEISIKNSLLIIDEIHNMVSESGLYYRVLYDALNGDVGDLRTVIMSATPIYDKPVELALTMNLLIDNKLPTGNEFINTFIEEIDGPNGSIDHRAINLDIISDRIKGYVSYFRGAPPHVFPKTTLHIVKCKMSDKQLKLYNKIIANEGNINIDLNDPIPNNFFIGSRMVSNFVFPNNKINEAGFASLKDSDCRGDKLKELSPKYYKALRKIIKTVGTVFIYSNFKEFGGIRTFARMLEANGFTNYEYHGQGRRRFAIWSGDQDNAVKDEIKAIYNNKNNENGSKIKIILGTPSAKEGVSFLRLQTIVLLEPYWNFSKNDQIIGRGSRFCSHKDVEEHRRVVQVYILLATHPTIRESIDQHIMEMAIKKRKLNNEFENILKATAIDCELFANANNYEGEEKISCVI